MKSKNICVKVFLLLAFIGIMKVEAQVGGCDLCGPSAGSIKNIASGNYSATIGSGCESRGLYSMAIGYMSKSYKMNAISMGKYVRAQATNSVVIGSGVGDDNLRALINGEPNSLMIGFNSCKPTFFVSSSSGYNTTGKIGIGNVVSPKAKLHIKSDNNEDAGIILEPSALSNSAYIQLYNAKNKICVSPNSGLSIVSQSGNINLEANQVSINTKLLINAPKEFSAGYDYALAVSGGILTTKVLVKDVSEWYDYVFKDDYELMSINDLEKYIDENGHLPEIPSENSVLTKGYDMAEMDGLLLKKIEELTLYTIELNKLVEQQREIIEQLQKK